MNRISFAFRSFFSILFGGSLAPDIAQAFGYSKAKPVKAPAPPKPQSGPSDGAVQVLGLLQREARLIDFLMEDLTGYSDEQVGAAVRDVQSSAKQAMERYLKLIPVVDGVEDTDCKTAGLEPDSFKLIGNVPASGKADSGVLRHKGWRADHVNLPKTPPSMVLAPAEIEVE